jgi:DNA-binding MarR family transcriptional regulator
MNDKWSNAVSISTIYTIFTTNRAMLDRLDIRLEPLGLSSAKLWPMAFIDAIDEPLTITALAECIDTTKSNATAMVDRLEASGLVTRTRSSEDRRAVQIELTPLGKERFEAAMQVMQEVNQAINALFTPEELARFYEYMERVSNCSAT